MVLVTEICLVIMWTSLRYTLYLCGHHTPNNFSIACVRVLKIKCNVFSCISKAWKVP
jgi:hypothetical protein